MPLWYNNDQRVPTPEDPTEPRPYDRISHIQQLYFDIFADDSFIPPVVDYTDMVKKTITAYINKFLLYIHTYITGAYIALSNMIKALYNEQKIVI